MSAQTAMAFNAQRPAPTPAAAPLDQEIRLVGAARIYGRDQEVFGQGEPSDFVFKVASGAVRSFRVLCDGRRQICEFHLPGDIFGLELDDLRHTAAEAIGEATLIVARRGAVIGEDAGNHAALWRKAAADLAACREHALTLGRRSAAERLAAFLLELADRTGVETLIDLPMSRQDIADYLGLTIETVSRTFTALQADGLIDARAGRRVRLVDRAALEELCQ